MALVIQRLLCLLWHLRVCLCALSLMSIGVVGQSQSVDESSNGRYSGVYAVCDAAKRLGYTHVCEQTLPDKYISSSLGSTAEDLVEYAKQLGVHATCYRGLGTASLRQSKDLLVIRTTSMGDFEVPRRWALILGADGASVRITEGRGKVTLVPIAALLARWDGTAVAIHKEPSPLSSFGAMETAAMLRWGCFALCFGVGLVSLTRRVDITRSIRSQLTYGGFLLVSTLSISLICEFATSWSFLRNWRSVAYVLAAEGKRHFPLVSTAEMNEVVTSMGDAVIIDTRRQKDFHSGHIRGALNLPITSYHEEIKSRLRTIDRRRPVILYSQSPLCGFDDKMAGVLANYGFDNIRLYRDGWVGWIDSDNANRSQM